MVKKNTDNDLKVKEFLKRNNKESTLLLLKRVFYTLPLRRLMGHTVFYRPDLETFVRSGTRLHRNNVVTRQHTWSMPYSGRRVRIRP